MQNNVFNYDLYYHYIYLKKIKTKFLMHHIFIKFMDILNCVTNCISQHINNNYILMALFNFLIYFLANLKHRIFDG